MEVRSQSPSIWAVASSIGLASSATPGPAVGGIDPLEIGIVLDIGQGEHGGGLLVGQFVDRALRRDRTVGEQQDILLRVEAVERVGDAAGDLDPGAVAAQPVDRLGERGGHPLDEQHDMARPRGQREPRLIFDQRAPGERKRGAQSVADICLVLRGDQRGERHVSLPPRQADGDRDVRRFGKARMRGPVYGFGAVAIVPRCAWEQVRH